MFFSTKLYHNGVMNKINTKININKKDNYEWRRWMWIKEINMKNKKQT